MIRELFAKNTSILRKIGFNKFTIILIFCLFVFTTGSTYAYYAYQIEDTVAITGNVVSIDADLEVDLVVGINEKMVPMNDEALSNALNGVGSTNGACIDAVGNLSCQVYRIKLINNGSRLKNLNGSIELYAREGSENVYTNLKWMELSNPTTIKSGSVINGMEKSFLVENFTVPSKETIVWYIAVWISEADYDQRETDKGVFGGTVKFEAGGGITTRFIREVMVANSVSDKDIDFSKTSVESNTNGIYYTDNKTRSTPIYYYRGNVNNNLIFADTCWKIVRTTETGGLKLIYNGVPNSGKCINTGTATQIGTKKFNSVYDSPVYVGYMYGTPYAYSYKTMNGDSTAYKYGNSVTYSGVTYTLENTISSSSWSSIYNGGLNNNHYTCFTTGTKCTSVYYIYYTESNYAYYITLSNGKIVEDALEEMLNDNITSSTIKGNNTTGNTLDYWYYNNIEQLGYDNYIEDTVWCNDRSISNLNGWDSNGGSTIGWLRFSGYDRVFNRYQIDLTCLEKNDSFTVSSDNGNGKLNYPVGLLTVDEVILAGGKGSTANSQYYLYTGSDYWLGTPSTFYGINPHEFIVYSSGELKGNDVYLDGGVRPSISLKAGFTVIGGDGTSNSPYVVGEKSEIGDEIGNRTITFYNGNTSIGTQEINNSSEIPLTSWSSLGGSVLGGYNGWNFAGWATSGSSNVIEYTNGSNITVTGDMNLHAVYSRELTVNYNANGGSGSINSTTKTIYINSTSTLTSSQSIILANNSFTKASNVFSKWMAGSTSGPEYSEGTAYNPNIVYNAIDFSITMYAKWTPETYIISYNANGGSGVPGSQTKTYGVNLTLSSVKPTKDGYSFLGWSTSSGATTPTYSAGGIYSANVAVTLYAVWGEALKLGGVPFEFKAETQSGDGLYIKNETQNDDNPIYYFKGDVDNNVIFANSCWKMVRTTDTGGLKMIYNGDGSGGECNNTGVSSSLGLKQIHSSANSLAYAGYMYGTVYAVNSKDMVSSSNTKYYYADGVSYSNGKYTLNGKTKYSNWSDIYNGTLDKISYTCFSSNNKCNDTVYYIYHTDETKAYYISLTGGTSVATALDSMLKNNTTSGALKGSNSISDTVDYWYYNNIVQGGLSSYIEDTVYCNDRSVHDWAGFSETGVLVNDLYFTSYNRLNNTNQPSLSCTNNEDKFTVSTSIGNGNLTYPVGLLTVDEAMLAGGSFGIDNTYYYLHSGGAYWLMTPYSFEHESVNNLAISGTGQITTGSTSSFGIRPVISLKLGYQFESGTGTETDPYIVD